ncbi:hypothetical protein [Photobacterium leiognathi]|uniref:hypothetical protein n=1 Tax=Photobacterium leiognathi TaxID=553611 RepID=UPI0029812C28|nr:hypothetical protein [Photobacterium leiognathi]
MKLELKKPLNIHFSDVELLSEPLNFCDKRKKAIRLSIQSPQLTHDEIAAMCGISTLRVKSSIKKYYELTRYYEKLFPENSRCDLKKLNMASLWLGYDSETRLALEGVIIYKTKIAKVAVISGINYKTLYAKIRKTKKLLGHFDRVVNSLTAFATTSP